VVPDLADGTGCLKGQQGIRTSRSLKDNVGLCIIKTVEAIYSTEQIIFE
jgi:hypothetical protein